MRMSFMPSYENELPCRKTCLISAPDGFALIVTVTLLMLVALIAVGLLSLSRVAMKTSGYAAARQEARANARMSLMLAIGDLQRQLGPDTRISMVADQISSGNGEHTTTPEGHRHWTGVYRSWPTAAVGEPRPQPEFLQWLVSGSPSQQKQRNYAAAPNSPEEIALVPENGSTEDSGLVRVPLMKVQGSNGELDRLAWWVGDQGVKALMAPSKKLPDSIAETRADRQTVAGSNLAGIQLDTTRPFAQVDQFSSRLAGLASWRSADLLTSSSAGSVMESLFHDFVTRSRGLVTNVRRGGFRRDLSMYLHRVKGSQLDPHDTALYRIGQEPGINMQELWTYYQIPFGTQQGAQGIGLKWSQASVNYTTGGTLAAGTPYLELAATPNAAQDDEFFYYKQPLIIDYQTIVSLLVREVNQVNRLFVVMDPVITMWNPLDVPVVVPSSLFFTVKFWPVPYDIHIQKNADFHRVVMPGYANRTNFLSLRMGVQERLVFKPGEVIKISQLRDLTVSSDVANIYAVDGAKGFNFGKGIAYEAKDWNGDKIDITENDVLVYQGAGPNNLTAGRTSRSGHSFDGGNANSRHFSLTHYEYFVGKDRDSNSLGIGGAYLDWDFGNRRLQNGETRQQYDSGTKPPQDRYYADQRPEIFPSFTDDREIPLSDQKMPILLFSYHAKTEKNIRENTRSLGHLNPAAMHVDFYDLSLADREMMPYEYTVEGLTSWKSDSDSLQVGANGQGYFGGGRNAATGSSYVTTHSVPREPIVSLAAFQNSFANGYNMQKPPHGYAILNIREPLLPQISHAIGNSLASPILAPDQTQGTISGGRPVADHSYLANEALWDDWFFSGIAPQTMTTFGHKRTQQEVATDFFAEHADGKLPVSRFTPNLRGESAQDIVDRYLPTTEPDAKAVDEIAGYLWIDGMFNVNSTSVAAWKSLLSSQQGRSLVTRTAEGKEAISAVDEDRSAVNGLAAPQNLEMQQGSSSPVALDQWVGWRSLSEQEIDSLAESIVREIRKRGPFLSLADFVNRRVEADKAPARAGVIQSALDSSEVGINAVYQTGDRVSSGGQSFAFKEAEQGPKSYGAPGIVKQADILTSIGPLLSARSDTFIIRGYGEKLDVNGKLLARACCEAVVQRNAEFISPEDSAEKDYAQINPINQKFGRRFEIISFRWLQDSEI